MSKIPRFGLFGSKPAPGPSPLAEAITSKDEPAAALVARKDELSDPVASKDKPADPVASKHELADPITNKDESGSLSDDKTETDDIVAPAPKKDPPVESQQPSSTEPEKPNNRKKRKATSKSNNTPSRTKERPLQKRQRRHPVTESSGLKLLYSKYEKQHEMYAKHKKLMNKAALQMHQTVLMIMRLKEESDVSPELTSNQATFKPNELDDSDSQSLPDPNDILE